MGLTLRGAVVGRKKLGVPKEGRSQFYAWLLRCPDGGGDFEVATSDKIGGAGEIVEIPVKATVNKTMGTVQFSPAKGDGFETDWDDDELPQSPPKPRIVPDAEQTRMAQTMRPTPPVTAPLNGSAPVGARP